MRALFWLLILAALAVGLSLAARYNEGYVLLVLPPWRAEVSLNLFLLAALAAFSVLYLLARAVNHTLGLPRAVAQFRRRRQQEKAGIALRDAWRLLQEGRYGHALRCAERQAPTRPAPGCWRWPAGARLTPCVIRSVRRNGLRACSATTAADCRRPD